MKLFMSGQKAAEVTPKLTPLMTKVKNALDSSEDGELFTTEKLARIIGHLPRVIREDSFLLPAYWHNIRANKKYWGKPITIKQLREELRKR